MITRYPALFMVLTDYCSAALAWAAFYYFRKIQIEQAEFSTNPTFWLGSIVIPLFWILLYYIIGTYQNVIRLHRFKILSQTFTATLTGSIGLFFALLLDDDIYSYQFYYKSILGLFAIHFICTIIPRYILTSYFVRRIQTRKVGFKTLLIGGSEKAVQIYEELEALPKSMGNSFVGFVNLNGIDTVLEEKLPYFGHVKQIEQVIREQEIEEVIIALDRSEHEKLKGIISILSGYPVRIKLIPDMYDIISGSVRMNNIFGALLLEVNSEFMPFWQQALKRIFDIVLSLIAFILLIPLYIVLSIAVLTSSKGPIFFLQERVGKDGIPFKIIKFRTMYTDAESKGPQLSSSNDPRITPVGRIMRKLRLDEFPQFINVIKGDMSLVGPRPERQFYIDQIVQKEPQFMQLTKIRPGITSWGQVKYGYAENVDQMLQRMKYDLLYLKNMSLALDFKIMLYTILIVVKAKGK